MSNTADIINELAIKIEETSRAKGFLRATWDAEASVDGTMRDYYIGNMGRRILELANAADRLRAGVDGPANRYLENTQEALGGLRFKNFDEPVVIQGNEIADIKLALVASELAEFKDALNAGDKDNAAEEVADAIIRLLDIGASLGLDVGAALVAKVEKNKARPPQHGKVSAA